MTTVLSKEFLRSAQRDIWSASTAAAGVAPGTVLSTTPPFSLWNPATSKVKLLIIDARCAFISGTLGAGALVYAFNADSTQPSGGTTLAVRPNVVGNNVNTPSGVALQGSTLSSTPLLLRPCLTLSASAPFVPVTKDYVEGDIMVLPGQTLALQAIAGAGTTPLVMLSVTWVEVTG